MLTVRDIMTATVHAVEADASAEEAAWGPTTRHIGGAPVRYVAGRQFAVETDDACPASHAAASSR